MQYDVFIFMESHIGINIPSYFHQNMNTYSYYILSSGSFTQIFIFQGIIPQYPCKWTYNFNNVI